VFWGVARIDTGKKLLLIFERCDMFRFIWIMIFLFTSIFVYAAEKVDGIGLDDDFEEGFQTIQPFEPHPFQGGTVATIGSDPACTYQAGTGVLQTAIDAGYDEIRLVKGTHLGNIEVLDKSVSFKGRYLNCLLAENDVPSNFVADNSIISGVSGAALPAVRISGDSQRNFVSFKNLTITNGEASPSLSGGGIDVRLADLSLTFDTVQITNNVGRLAGGGLSVFLGSTNVFMVDTFVAFNNAQEGGGVYCIGNDASINMWDTGPENPSGIAANHATNGDGGGLYVGSGCNFFGTSGSYNLGGVDFNGIVLNSATGDGGGVYVSSGGRVNLDGARRCPLNFCEGNNDSNVRVSGNIADSDDDNDGSGGGIYAKGLDTQVDLTNALIEDNTARNGGGLAVTDRAEISMTSHYTDERSLVLCWNPGSCSQIIGNEATSSGGGVDISDGGYMELYLTVIEGNRGTNATALRVSSQPGNDQSYLVLVGSLVTDNGITSNGGVGATAILIAGNGRAFIGNNTLADNGVSTQVILAGADAELFIFSTIIHELNGVPVYKGVNSPKLSASYLMLSSIDDFVVLNSPSIVVNDPEFVNRAAGDFHLTDGSPAVDASNIVTYNLLIDLDGDLRRWDDPAVHNFPFDSAYIDIGYDENYRYTDVIFKDGFEGRG